eukprot:TRINITY_DN20050_c0_g1_i1.p1 TRINITY_DN20050_c0_g1~~TRINITY_DN20050_c0_g1_i1.p1  ORF type:complete len:389 (+),score=145.09 TRINITY_DN20050_c0_g1_i1:53-1219(+)
MDLPPQRTSDLFPKQQTVPVSGGLWPEPEQKLSLPEPEQVRHNSADPPRRVAWSVESAARKPFAIDPSAYAEYKKEREAEEVRSVLRPSPYLSRGRDSVVGAGQDAVVSRDEHKAVVDDLAAAHADEIRRSDVVHARHSNDLVAAVESARAERDARKRENERLRMELRELDSEGGHLQAVKARKERAAEGTRAGQAKRRELQRELAAVREENDALRHEISRVAETRRRQEAEHQGAIAELEAEYGAVSAAVDELSARLRQGTVDFKDLDRTHRELNAQIRLGEPRLRKAEEALARRDEARRLVADQIVDALSLCRDAEQRASAAAVARPASVLSPKSQPAAPSSKRSQASLRLQPGERTLLAEHAQADLLQIGQALVRLSQLLSANSI